MEEEKGFSSTHGLVAENNPNWALLHLYGLLKIPEVNISKIHGSGP